MDMVTRVSKCFKHCATRSRSRIGSFSARCWRVRKDACVLGAKVWIFVRSPILRLFFLFFLRIIGHSPPFLSKSTSEIFSEESVETTPEDVLPNSFPSMPVAVFREDCSCSTALPNTKTWNFIIVTTGNQIFRIEPISPVCGIALLFEWDSSLECFMRTTNI